MAGVLTSDDKPGPALAFISSSLLPQLSRILSLLDIANIAVLKAIFSLLSLINEKIGSHVILEEFLPLLSSQVLNTEEEMKALKESSPPQPKRESMELEDSDDVHFFLFSFGINISLSLFRYFATFLLDCYQ